MLVSVIIPCYNVGKYISKTLDSVVNQTYKNVEIIVVDDGSTDETLSIIKSIKDPRIILIQQKNLGAGVARNVGIKRSSGQYIQFLDGDDFISYDKVELQLNDIRTYENAVSICQTVRFKDGDNYLESKSDPYENNFLFNSNVPLDFLMNLWGVNNNKQGSMIQTNVWLTPKSLVDKAGYWVEFVSPDDDGEYFSRILQYAEKIIFNKVAISYYRTPTNSSLSHRNTFEKLNGALRTTLLKEENLKSLVSNEKLKTAIDRQLFDIIFQSYPLYPEIYKNPKVTYRHLKPYSNFYHNKALAAISSIFHWKIARYIQYFKNKHLFS